MEGTHNLGHGQDLKMGIWVKKGRAQGLGGRKPFSFGLKIMEVLKDKRRKI